MGFFHIPYFCLHIIFGFLAYVENAETLFPITVTK